MFNWSEWYNPNSMYFESIILIRKLLVILSLTLYMGEPLEQTYFSFGLSIVYGIFITFVPPYQKTTLHIPALHVLHLNRFDIPVCIVTSPLHLIIHDYIITIICYSHISITCDCT